MPLVVGQRLSFYEILAPLGVGGMGEVYRAHDTKLEREVALKVLPEELAHDVERLQRFRREAKSLAALNHPNIAQVYGIDEVEGTALMAIELVPGEDLATRLARGPLPLADSIDLCRQIAEGVEAAHEAGVIHRDLKPANVVITPDGKAKVLDFGIAKRAESEWGADPGEETLANTIEGHLLGTPVYMAPEQGQGKPADRRVDVWAFGCVLFECLTGRKTFGGKGVGDVLAAIMKEDPDWGRLPTGTPTPVRTLLARCLDKNPRTRLRDLGEARILLERDASASHQPETQTKRRGPMLASAALALGALGVGLLIGSLAPDRAPSSASEENEASAVPVFRQLRLTEMVGIEETPAMSPDGRRVAFVARVNGRRQVFVRLLASGSTVQLTDSGSGHRFPRWVNDDTLIYLRQSEGENDTGSFWEQQYIGSSAPRLLLTSAQGEADVDRDSKQIAMFRNDFAGFSLVIVDYANLAEEKVYPLPPSTAYRSPRWSPDGRYLALESRIGLSKAEIQLFDPDGGGEPRTIALVTGQTRGLAWLPDGSGLVYSSSEGSTVAYPPLFNLRVVDIQSGRDTPLPCDTGGYASFVEPDISQAGKLVASRIAIESDIFKYPVVIGSPRENVENAEQITRQTGIVQVPSASPSGDQVAYLSNRGGRANIWVTSGGEPDNPRRLTNEKDPDVIIGLPLWSPTGELITYWRGPPNSRAEQWLIPPNGNERMRRRLVQCRGGASWSPDGEWLYYIASTDDPFKTTIERISVAGGQPEVILEGASGWSVTRDGKTGYFQPSDVRVGEVWKVTFGDGDPVREDLRTDLKSRIPLWPHHYSLSPDEKWLATPLQDNGTTNLWVISTEDSRLEQITDFGDRSTTIGRQVSWSHDESSGEQYIFAALMETDADIVELEGLLGGTPKAR